jgi:hypothetical protein
MDAPEEVVRELSGRRSLEGDDSAALRVDAREDLPDDPVLAGGIETLKDEEEAALVLGKETLLEDADPLDELLQLLPPSRLVETKRRARVTRHQAGRPAGLYTELVDQDGKSYQDRFVP